MIVTEDQCPGWCRTDHDAERREWAAMQEQTERYILEHPVEMRQAFGADYQPPASGVVTLLDMPMHEQEIGRVHVLTGLGDDLAPVSARLQQCSDEPAGVMIEDQVYNRCSGPRTHRAAGPGRRRAGPGG